MDDKRYDFERYGREGAQKRWSRDPKRVMRLADYSPEEQAILQAVRRLREARLSRERAA
jgi:hypothetical protein